MLNKFKSALYTAVGGLEDSTTPGLRELTDVRLPKFPYSRPHFLRLASEDEVQVAGDRSIRPIMVPRDIDRMPWMSGYAEAVNAGKSKRNEDNAHIHVGTVQQRVGAAGDPPAAGGPGRSVQYYYFGVFDGHAGHGASTAAANQLHQIVHEKLVDVVDHLLPAAGAAETLDSSPRPAFLWVPPEELSVDKLVTGALEAAFNEMDTRIAEDRRKYEMRGGCTALVALFLLGRLYVANAGDSRATVCRRGRAVVASHDFTPETERQRVRQLACRQPALCGGEFTHLEFCRRVTRRDLGKRLLYRDAHMTGWAYKTVTEDDIKFPVVCGEGKRSRVCATIGVTRGFGDHGLRAQNTGVYVKPFLLSQPEVLVINLEEDQVTASDVLIMATDGLWDVISNETVAQLVERALNHFPAEDETMRRYRCTSAAQELVMAARGKLRENRQWRMADGSPATVDDISVFVIPLLPYREEHLLWKVAGGAAAPPAAAAPQPNGVTVPPAGGGQASAVNGELTAGAADTPTTAPDGDARQQPPAAAAVAAVAGRRLRPADHSRTNSTETRTPAAENGALHPPGPGPASRLTGWAADTGQTERSGRLDQTDSGPSVPVSSVRVPAPPPSSPTVPVTSPPTVPSPSSLTVTTPPNSAVSVLPTPAVSVPSNLTVPASSTQTVPSPSSLAQTLPSASVPSSPVVPSLCNPVRPVSSALTVPSTSTPAVSIPSRPAAPAPSSLTVSTPPMSAAPAPSSPCISTPLVSLVPTPSSPPASTSPVSAAPAPSSPTVSTSPVSAAPAPSSPAASTPPESAVSALPSSPRAPALFSPTASTPSGLGVPVPSPQTPAIPSMRAVPVPCSSPVSAPHSPAAPVPPSPVVSIPPVSGPSTQPLIVGQAVPPTLVQTVPRSSVKLLPPAPPTPTPPPPQQQQ